MAMEDWYDSYRKKMAGKSTKKLDFEQILQERKTEYILNRDAGRREQEEKKRRKFVLDIFGQMAEGLSRQKSVSSMLAYMAPTFLMLHYCGGIRENLRSVMRGEFSEAADAVCNGNPSMEKLRERCRETSGTDRMPYEPVTAALDAVAMDVDYYSARCDAGSEAEREDLGRRYEKGVQEYETMLAGDMGEGQMRQYAAERGKTIAAMMLEHPNTCAVYGIDPIPGDPVWDHLVKVTGAQVSYGEDGTVTVESYRMPMGEFPPAPGMEKNGWSARIGVRNERSIEEQMSYFREGLDAGAVREVLEQRKHPDRELSEGARILKAKVRHYAFMMQGDGFPKADIESAMFAEMQDCIKEAKAQEKRRKEAEASDRSPDARRDGSPGKKTDRKTFGSGPAGWRDAKKNAGNSFARDLSREARNDISMDADIFRIRCNGHMSPSERQAKINEIEEARAGFYAKMEASGVDLEDFRRQKTVQIANDLVEMPESGYRYGILPGDPVWNYVVKQTGADYVCDRQGHIEVISHKGIPDPIPDGIWEQRALKDGQMPDFSGKEDVNPSAWQEALLRRYGCDYGYQPQKGTPWQEQAVNLACARMNGYERICMAYADLTESGFKKRMSEAAKSVYTEKRKGMPKDKNSGKPGEHRMGFAPKDNPKPVSMKKEKKPTDPNAAARAVREAESMEVSAASAETEKEVV